MSCGGVAFRPDHPAPRLLSLTRPYSRSGTKHSRCGTQRVPAQNRTFSHPLDRLISKAPGHGTPSKRYARGPVKTVAQYGPEGSKGSKGRNIDRAARILEDEKANPTPGVVYRPSESYGKLKLDLVRKAQWVFLARTQSYGSCWYAETHAGTGFVRIEENGELLLGSTLQAAVQEPHFERLAFIEKKADYRLSLEAAFQRYRPYVAIPNQEVVITGGDSNQVGIDVIRQIADHTRTIGLVFVDPEGLDYEYPLLQGIASLSCRKDLLMLFPYNMAMARKWQDTPEKVLAMFSPDRRAVVAAALDARQKDEKLRAENVLDVVTKAAADDLRALGWAHVHVTETMRRAKANTPLYNIVYATVNPKGGEIFAQLAKIRTAPTTLGQF